MGEGGDARGEAGRRGGEEEGVGIDALGFVRGLG